MNLKKIFQFFPPPKFLDLPYAGIHISDKAVRCISFSRKNNTLHLEGFTEKLLPNSSIIDGSIQNIDAVVSVLSDIKKEFNLNYVKMSLPEEKAYLFTAKIPFVNESEIKSSVESKIEENVPVSPMELIFDYKIFERPDKDLIDVVVSALPINVVDSYLELAEKSGLSLLSLEIESQAMTRSVVPKSKNDTCLIVNYSEDKVGLYVSVSGVVRFTSTVQTRGEFSNNHAFLIQEIKRLYTYWHTLKENTNRAERKISHIYVCGENIDDSLVSFITNNSKTESSLANVWVNVFDINKNVPEIPFVDSLKYAGAIGLAMPSKIFI